MKILLSPAPPRRPQRGTALVVALIMLLLLTMLGVSSLRTTTMEERMAGNMRDQQLAFQAAEAALREAEAWLRPLSGQPPASCGALAEGCNVYRSGLLASDAALFDYAATWWNTNATAYSTDMDGVPSRPRYVREELTILPDDLTIGQNIGGTTADSTNRYVYRITARGTGQTGDAVVLLQTTYYKRY